MSGEFAGLALDARFGLAVEVEGQPRLGTALCNADQGAGAGKADPCGLVSRHDLLGDGGGSYPVGHGEALGVHDSINHRGRGPQRLGS